MSNRPLSNCCKAKVESISSNEGTGYYICTKCHNPTDPYVKIILKAATVSNENQIEVSNRYHKEFPNGPKKFYKDTSWKEEIETDILILASESASRGYKAGKEGSLYETIDLQKEAIEHIDTLITQVQEEIAKAYGGCTNCYGKGYSTIRYGYKTSADFEGDSTVFDPIKTHIEYCECDRGKQLKKLKSSLEEGK